MPKVSQKYRTRDFKQVLQKLDSLSFDMNILRTISYKKVVQCNFTKHKSFLIASPYHGTKSKADCTKLLHDFIDHNHKTVTRD